MNNRGKWEVGREERKENMNTDREGINAQAVGSVTALFKVIPIFYTTHFLRC